MPDWACKYARRCPQFQEGCLSPITLLSMHAMSCVLDTPKMKLPGNPNSCLTFQCLQGADHVGECRAWSVWTSVGPKSHCFLDAQTDSPEEQKPQGNDTSAGCVPELLPCPRPVHKRILQGCCRLWCGRIPVPPQSMLPAWLVHHTS